MANAVNLPPKVSAFFDRHGKPRYRFRHKGLTVYVSPVDFHRIQYWTNLTYWELKAEIEKLNARKKERLRKKVKATKEATGKITGYVYFVSNGNGHVKIGYTTLPKSRLVDIQAYSPTPISLLAITKGTLRLERSYHQKFKRWHTSNEWFELSDEIQEEITNLATKNVLATSGEIIS